MARTSFLQAVSAYLDAMKPYYQASTIERYGRDLRTGPLDCRVASVSFMM